MKSNEAESNSGDGRIAQGQQHAAQFTKVFDGRKRRIRGLWERNGSFYAQLTVEDAGSGKKLVRRVRLEDAEGNPVPTVADAKMAMDKLRVKREDESTLSLMPKRTPTFQDYSKIYLDHFTALKDAKRPATLRTERICISRWNEYLGQIRLREINKPLVTGFMAKRQQQDEVSARTVNLELVTLRNVLRKAVDDGYLPEMPIDGIKWLKHKAAVRRLISHKEIDQICAAAIEHCENGQQLADFIRLMAYSGGRWSETLRLKWTDVNFQQKQIRFGADGLAKNHESRVVDFNAKLQAHLKAMTKRRAPDSEFLFPSPRRGANNDVSAVTFNMALRQAREKAKVPDFTCHLCRHFFISFCIMSGLDYMTIARWVGHKDGGILIGKVYGHLSSEHTKAQAQKVSFQPTVLKAANA